MKIKKMALLKTAVCSVFFNIFIPVMVFAANKNIDVNSAGTSKIVTLISTYLKIFGGITVMLGLILTAAKIIISARKPDAREEGMENIFKVSVGAVMIGSAVLIAGFLVGLSNNMAVPLNVGNNAGQSITDSASSDPQGNFVARAIVGVIESPINAIVESIGKFADFQPLSTLIFNNGSAMTLPPFKDVEWSNLCALYIAVASFMSPLLLIMVGKTGFSYIFSSNSVSKKVDLKEEILHWFFCIMVIATGPFLVQGLFQLCNMLLELLKSTTSSLWSIPTKSPAFDMTLIQSIHTGSIISSVIVKLLFVWKYLQINIIFMTRKITLSVMFVFTPIAAALWGINKTVQAFPIWFGEMLSNAAMQFFYAFTFIVMIVCLGSSGWTSWLYSLIWMFALIKVAEVLRNSLQGFFARLSGIDEAGIGSNAVGAIGGMVAGAAAAFGGSVGSKGKAFDASSVAGQVFGGAMGGNKFGKNNPNGSSSNGGNNGTSPSGGGSDNGGSVPSPNMSGDNQPGNESSGSSTSNGNYSPSQSSSKGENTNSSGAQSYGAAGDDFVKRGSEQPYYGADSAGGSGVAAETGSGSSQQNGRSAGNQSGGRNKNGESSSLDSLKAKSSQQALYNNMLADNINRNMAGRHNVGGMLNGMAQTMRRAGANGMVSGIVNSAGNIATGMQNRRAVGRAINQTVDQMQEMSGGNMDKEQAVNTLFGNKNILKSTGLNKARFVSAVAHGNNGRAASILAKAHPFNQLNQKEKNDIIAQTNPYTSIDGFSNWKN